jgi:hypothetical protein
MQLVPVFLSEEFVRRLLFFLVISAACMSQASFAQDWQDFTSKEDFFTATFPGEPVVTEVPWQSEYGAYLPARIYAVKQGQSTYAITVVDYNLAKDLLIANARACPATLERCKKLATYANTYKGLEAYTGEGFWKNDVRGAMLYATFKYTQRDVKVTYLGWNQMGQGLERNELQMINNADKSITFVSVYMHRNRLYVVEDTTPANSPPPGLFGESINFLEDDGSRVRHEGMHFNGAMLDPDEIK